MNLLREPLFLALFNTPLPRLIVQADAPRFTIVAGNDAQITFTQADSDITGRSLWEVFRDEELNTYDIRQLCNALTKALQNGKPVLVPAFIYTASATDNNAQCETNWWQIEVTPIAGADGKWDYLLLTAYSITEETADNNRLIEQGLLREQELNEELAAMNEELAATNEELRQSEGNLQVINEHLVESEERFRALVQQAPVAIAIYSGVELIVELANDKMLGIWGRTADEVMGKPLLKARPEIKGHPNLNILQNAYASGIAYHDYKVKGPVLQNGNVIEGYFDYIYQPLKNNRGAVTGLIIVVTDVTEQANARKEIDNAYAQTHLAKQAAQLGMFDMDLLKGTMEWDDRCRKLFGISHQETVTYEKDFLPGLHKEDRERISKVIDDAFNKEKSNGEYDVEYRTVGAEDGQLRWVRAKGKVFFDRQDVPVRFIGSVMDISEQMTARKDLEKAKDNLNLAIEAAEMATWNVDFITSASTISDRGKIIYGISPEASLTLPEAMEMIIPEHREDVIEAIERAMQTGNNFVNEFIIHPKDGSDPKWLRVSGKVYYGEQGNPLYIAGTILDITEPKQDDIRKNDFIGMVSHELKTPITSIKAYLQLLKSTAQKDENAFTINLLSKAENQVNKMTAMVQGFLDISRLESGKIYLTKETFLIDTLIQEIIEETVTQTHTVHLLPCEELEVHADREKIGHVIHNLLSNAVKYSPQGSTVQVHCIVSDDTVIVSVQDEGIGIQKMDLEKLFDRYYRVQNDKMKTVAGFGIGLYLCDEIIKRHNGKIWAKSEEGEGATFFFCLPKKAAENL